MMYEDYYEKADVYFSKAYALSIEHQNPAISGKLLVDKARLLRDLGAKNKEKRDEIMQKAENQYKVAITFADSLGYKSCIAYAYERYGSFVSGARRNEEKALQLVSKALGLYQELDDKYWIEACYNRIGSIYRHSDQPEEAILYFRKALELATELEKENTLHLRYLGLSNSYKDIKDYKNALTYYTTHKLLLVKRMNLKNARKIAQKDAAFTYEKQKAIDSLRFVQQKNEAEKAIKRKADLRFWAISVLLVLFVLIAIITYLAIKKRTIEAEAEALSQHEKNTVLTMEVSQQKQEILALVDENITHQRQKAQLKQNLEKLAKREEGVTLKSILIDLKTNGIDDSKLNMVKDNINEITYDFKRKIRKKHPELSKTDIEICSFIKLGLSRKEIANLRNTSIYAIKSSRYRLKKKIGLSKEENLMNYLDSI
ncbi:MAG: tetratricopeptide repeat protein [Bacteroidota bacterium]